MFDKKEGVSLESIWKLRMKLINEAKKIFDESKAVTEESNRLHNDGIELHKKAYSDTKNILVNDFRQQIKGEYIALKSNEITYNANQESLKAEKLKLEANKLRILGEDIWIEAVYEVFGNIKIEFKDFNEKKHSHKCILYLKDATTKIFNP